MRRLALLAALPIWYVAGAASDADPPALAQALEGRVPGPSRTCITVNRAAAPQPAGTRAILFRDGRTIWRNDLPDACPALLGDPVIVQEAHGGQICRNDRFRTVPRMAGGGIASAPCRLGSFTPWRPVAAP